jgi:hypothetical protein
VGEHVGIPGVVLFLAFSASSGNHFAIDFPVLPLSPPDPPPSVSLLYALQRGTEDGYHLEVYLTSKNRAGTVSRPFVLRVLQMKVHKPMQKSRYLSR